MCFTEKRDSLTLVLEEAYVRCPGSCREEELTWAAELWVGQPCRGASLGEWVGSHPAYWEVWGSGQWEPLTAQESLVCSGNCRAVCMAGEYSAQRGWREKGLEGRWARFWAPITFCQAEVLKRGFKSITCSVGLLTMEWEGTGSAPICFANCAPDKPNTPNLKAWADITDSFCTDTEGKERRVVEPAAWWAVRTRGKLGQWNQKRRRQA